MFAVIFPGQGSQSVGMAKELYNKYISVKKLFNKADEILGYSISELILEGPQENLNKTINTQPAIFLVSFSIFTIIKSEFKIDLNKAKYFAGHSLGEYSALASANAINFEDTIKLLSKRGKSMQEAVPLGEGAMIVILGKEINEVEKILNEVGNSDCQIANDNSPGQVVVSGKSLAINNLSEYLKKNLIKNIKLPVSAPFHCKFMKKSTEIMREEINKIKIIKPIPKIISNVNGVENDNSSEIKELLINQIESRVRWRESILYMVDNGVKKFIEIGPGKVLTGLIKRINKNVESISINNEDDIKKIKIHD